MGVLVRSTTTREFRHAIVVWSEDLLYLDTYLSKVFTKVEYEAQCQDNSKLEPIDLDQLLAYENPDFRKITSLSIKASRGGVGGDSVVVVLGKPDRHSDVTASVSYRFQDVRDQTSIQKDIDQRIISLRPWHSWLTKIPFFILLPSLLFLLSLLLNVSNILGKLTGSIPLGSGTARPSAFSESEITVIGWALFGILFIVGYILDRLRGYLFPKLWVCIGRQQKAYEKRRNIANLIFGVIGLGIVINIISNVLTPK